MDDFFSKVASNKSTRKETSGKKGRKNVCKGKQPNGSRCKDDPISIVGFCVQHFDQVNWTRELVEKMMEARKSDTKTFSEMSVLIGADLTGLDLSDLNFALVQFSSFGLTPSDSPLSMETHEIGITKC